MKYAFKWPWHDTSPFSICLIMPRNGIREIATTLVRFQFASLCPGMEFGTLPRHKSVFNLPHYVQELNSEYPVFVLSVWLSVCLWLCYSLTLLQKINFNLGHNFWIVRERDFIFGMHTQLMEPIQMTPKSMNLWPCPWPLYYYSQYGLCCHRGHSCFTKHPFFI